MNLAISGIDLAIVVAYMAAVVAFGLWVGRGQRNVESYLLGGRSLPGWGVLLSIVATETSTVTFLSVPGLAFGGQRGVFVFLQLALGLIVGRFVVVFLFLPHYFRGTLFTAYEVLDRRFGGPTKQTASMLFLVSRNLSDGLRLFLTGLVLRHVVGLDLAVCIAAIGLATIVYTLVGGMRSVVWNDCAQFVVYILGALVALVVLLDRIPGGWQQVQEFSAQRGTFRMFDFSFDPAVEFTFWTGLAGGAFLALATHGTDQLMVQRYLAAGSRGKAGAALAASGLIVFAQFALFLFIGGALACYYSLHPGDVAGVRDDEVFAQFVVNQLPTGVVGITLAAVFAAAMSTLSSSLNSSATAAVRDLYLSHCRKPPTETRQLNLSRGLTVFFGLVQIGVALVAGSMDLSVVKSVLAIASFVAGPILGVFFLGVLTRRTRQADALVGLVAGIATLTCVWGFSGVAWTWYALIGSTATTIAGLIAHLVFPVSCQENGPEGRPE